MAMLTVVDPGGMMHAGPVHHHVRQLTNTRLPIPAGEFRVCLFGGTADGKEHMAIVMGDVRDQSNVLVRIHSECFTGDVLGSLRCDCGEQLAQALQRIGEEGRGVVVYLRQEGRGIGLFNKLKAYDLQDQGYDTVEANVLLGHEPDERDYTIGAEILDALGVRSIRLMTNNPLKVAALSDLNIEVSERVPLEVNMNPENVAYLMTKAVKMKHLLSFNGLQDAAGPEMHDAAVARRFAPTSLPRADTQRQRPTVTLSYAQSLDGSIAARHGEPLALSGEQSLRMTHRLRASHDAILVGIGTVLADDPRLTVRLVEGRDPQPVVVDSQLSMPLDANLFRSGRKCPWIVTTLNASTERQQELENAGARVIRVPASPGGRVDLTALLRELDRSGIQSVMVEGGSRIITEFFRQRLVDQVVVTVTPQLVGGVRALDGRSRPNPVTYPRLGSIRHQRLGEDIVIWGVPVWNA